MVKAESKIRMNWQPISEAIEVHYEPQTVLQLSYNRIYRRNHGVSCCTS